jgi:hypothetical protein
MKNKSNLSLILSVISLVGVVILFVLYFMEPSNGKKGVPKAFESEAHRIAFFAPILSYIIMISLRKER